MRPSFAPIERSGSCPYGGIRVRRSRRSHKGRPTDTGGSTYGEDARGETRTRSAANIDSKWNKAKRTKRLKPSKAEREAATDSVVSDLVEWMALHPTVANQIDELASALGDDVVAELDRSLDGERRTRIGRLLADHAWCGMLATLAEILNEAKRHIDQIPGIAADALIAQMRGPGTSSWVKERQVEIYLKIAWKGLQEVLPTVEPAPRAIRMLAVMICPAPSDTTLFSDTAFTRWLVSVSATSPGNDSPKLCRTGPT